MLHCVKEAQQYEKEIYYKFIAKCSTLFGSSMVCMYLCLSSFVLGPAFLPVSFPFETEYPFRVNYTPMYVIIYMHEAFVAYRCSAHGCLNIFGALLLWFTAARLECLAIEMKQTTNVRKRSDEDFSFHCTLCCRNEHVCSYFMWHYFSYEHTCFTKCV
ncbi:uncharacterized protein LOC122529317 [Frieseomelitta varia]|uniref:uncharacterized protein LOC122529317 n=1 Tax=Frieseomelitta varia TaxID=561572 RepID=UPI001CB68B60|nr:uncharacterized protein LOC122529317 [Frieseomelitta varia]